MLCGAIVAASLRRETPGLRDQLRVGTSDGTDGPLLTFTGSLSSIAPQVLHGGVFLSGPELMLIHSLYHQSASMESVCDDWDRMVHFSRHNPRQVVYRYYKDKDQIHLDLSMVRLGDIGGLMLAAKMRASLPRELHPAVHWSHLQQLIVSRIQELNWRPLVSWRWLMHYTVHITKTLPRLSRLEASDNRIGTAGVQILCEALKTIPPEPGQDEWVSDDEYQK